MEIQKQTTLFWHSLRGSPDSLTPVGHFTAMQDAMPVRNFS